MRIEGESKDYRAARDQLLVAEAELRAQTEAVAAKRRALPVGPLAQRYAFKRSDGGAVDLHALFGDRDTLFFYSLMYAPAKGQGVCPMCAAMLDSLDGAAEHIGDRAAVAIGAEATPDELTLLSAAQGWSRLSFVSTAGTSFRRDYGAETEDGGQLPMAHVFTRAGEEIRLFWQSELLHAEDDWPHHPRHLDTIWPLWNVFDLTPRGRGADWMPKLSYS